MRPPAPDIGTICKMFVFKYSKIRYFQKSLSMSHGSMQHTLIDPSSFKVWCFIFKRTLLHSIKAVVVALLCLPKVGFAYCRFLSGLSTSGRLTHTKTWLKQLSCCKASHAAVTYLSKKYAMLRLYQFLTSTLVLTKSWVIVRFVKSINIDTVFIETVTFVKNSYFARRGPVSGTGVLAVGARKLKCAINTVLDFCQGTCKTFL